MHRHHPILGRAFTLLELLVVIAIVVVLLGVLLPVLGKARASTRAAMCLSNLRQLHLATALYQGDHRGAFPQPSQDSDIPDGVGSTSSPAAEAIQGAALWFNALDPYLNQEKRAYSAGDEDERNYREFKQDPVWSDWDGAARDENRTIKMNEFFGHTSVVSGPVGTWRFYRDLDVRVPVKTVVYIDGRAGDTPSDSGGIGGREQFWVREVYVGLRHDQGANAAFADGSASHHRYPIYRSVGGYRGWFDDDDPDASLRPAVVFRFRD